MVDIAKYRKTVFFSFCVPFSPSLCKETSEFSLLVFSYTSLNPQRETDSVSMSIRETIDTNTYINTLGCFGTIVNNVFSRGKVKILHFSQHFIQHSLSNDYYYNDDDYCDDY